MILAEDEGGFGRIDHPRRCWAPKPLRPRVPRQGVRELVYGFAAVRARLGRLRALILPTANTERMSLFLAHLAQPFRDYFIVLLLHGAGWQRAKALVVSENIGLLP